LANEATIDDGTIPASSLPSSGHGAACLNVDPIMTPTLVLAGGLLLPG
jgi:hypothetical protein